MVVEGQLPYSTHFIIIVCVMGLSQFNIFINLEQEGPMYTLALILFSTLEQKGLMWTLALLPIGTLNQERPMCT